MNVTDIINSITRGEQDDQIPLILSAINMRKKSIDTVAFAQISVGDRIEFNSRCNPKYLARSGVLGTVRSVDRMARTAIVDLDERVYGTRRSYHRGITVPMGIMDKVS